MHDKDINIWAIVKDHLFNYFNCLNLILFIFVLTTNKLQNGLFIGAVIFSSSLAIYHTLKAKRQLRKLTLFIQEKYTVKRLNDLRLSRDEIQVHDLVTVSFGQQIPVDAVIEDGCIEVNEAILTGEDVDLLKQKGDFVVAGSSVTSGIAKLSALTTASDSQMEKYLASTKEIVKKKIGLEKELDQFIHFMAILILPIGLILYYLQRANSSYEVAVLKTVAALIGMIPEGLVVLTSMAKILAALRLSKKAVLTQNLLALENLARVDTICLDKTGTITSGNLQVKEVYWINKKYVYAFKKHVNQDKTPNATQLACQKYFGYDKEKVDDYLAFSSKRKYSASKIGEDIFLMGSSETLHIDAIPVAMDTLQKQGYRIVVLAKAKGILTKPFDIQAVAYVVLQDELNSSIKETLNYLQKEKVDIRIISGDNEKTVTAIAQKAGLLLRNKSANVNANIDYNLQIFGRVLPKQKKEIVAALQKQGHIVAMVGDGVNDVAALRQADVSISFAKAHGAAKNIADIVLVDNDFKQVPLAIEEGRRIIHNISASASLFFMKTIYSFIFSLGLICFHFTYPFMPIQLTILSVFGVGIPSFLLQIEKHPEPIEKAFLKKAMLRSLPCALHFIIGILFLQSWYLSKWIFIYAAGSYIMTLCFIYPPSTWLRRIVISTMFLAYVIAIYFGHYYLQISLPQFDFSFFLFLVIITIGNYLYEKGIKRWQYK